MDVGSSHVCLDANTIRDTVYDLMDENLCSFEDQLRSAISTIINSVHGSSHRTHANRAMGAPNDPWSPDLQDGLFTEPSHMNTFPIDCLDDLDAFQNVKGERMCHSREYSKSLATMRLEQREMSRQDQEYLRTLAPLIHLNMTSQQSQPIEKFSQQTWYTSLLHFTMLAMP